MSISKSTNFSLLQQNTILILLIKKTIMYENTNQSVSKTNLPLIPLRIPNLPIPSVPAHGCQTALSAPMQNLGSFVHIGPNLRQVTGTPRANLIIHLDTVHLLKGIDNIKHAVRSTGPYIEGLYFLPLNVYLFPYIFS